MAVSYEKLWDKLHFSKINKSDLAERCGFSRNTLSKMNKDKPVHMKVIHSICQELHCNIEDIVEITQDNNS